MFNVVGYMNYRYFFLFLGYVLLACVYGLCLTAVPFIEQVYLIALVILFASIYDRYSKIHMARVVGLFFMWAISALGAPESRERGARSARF